MHSVNTIPHSPFDDAQALLVAPLFVAFAVLLFQHAGLLTGGAAFAGASPPPLAR